MPLQTQKVGPHEREPSFALAPYHEGEVAKVIWSATASLEGQMDLRKLDRSRVLPTINVNWRISSFRVVSYKDLSTTSTTFHSLHCTIPSIFGIPSNGGSAKG